MLNSLKKIVAANSMDHNAVMSSMFSAVETGDENVVKHLLDKGEVDVNQTDKNARTPLHIAAERGYIDIVGVLLGHNGIDINALDYDGNSALIKAIGNNHMDVVEALVNAGSNLHGANLKKMLSELGQHNIADYINGVKNKGEVLLAAIKDGTNKEMLSYLLEDQSLMNYSDNSGQTPLYVAVEFRNTEVVTTLLGLDEINPNLADDDDRTPLFIAVNNTNDKFRKAALQDPDAVDETNYGIVEKLLQNPKIDVNAANDDGTTPLHVAAEKGELAIVNALLDNPNIDINAKDLQYQTPIYLASKNNHKDVFNTLLSDPRIDISFGYKSNQTLLHVIVKKQWRMIDGLSDLLLKNGVNVNARDSKGNTPLDIVKKNPFSGLKPYFDLAIERGEALIEAVKNCNHETLGQLIQEIGHSLGYCDLDGKSVLYHALYQDTPNQVIIKMLEDNGADINQRNNHGKTLLHIAIEQHSKLKNKYDEVSCFQIDMSMSHQPVAYQWRDNAKPVMPANDEQSKTLETYNKQKNEVKLEIKRSYNLIRKLLERIDVNVMDDNNDTPLNVAAEHGHTDIVRLLLGKQGIDVNQANYDEQSPLLSAVKGGHADIVRLLLEKQGIDVNVMDDNNDTPLHVAAKHGHADIVSLLLAKEGIELNPLNKNGMSPLCVAADEGHTEVVELLLAKDGIDVNKSGKYGVTPLRVAAQKGHTEVVELLLAKEGIDVNKSVKNGFTPLHVAAEHGHADIVRLLLDKQGIDVNVMDDNNDTPLHVAVQHGHADIVRLLLDKQGINVNQRDKSGRTPLYIAVERGNLKMVNLLLNQNGIKVMLGDNMGQTPLHLAAVNNRTDIMSKLLLNDGINVNKSAEFGVTPLHLAAKYGYAEVVKQLLAKEGIELNPLTKNGMSPLYVATQNGDAAVVRLLLAKEGIELNQLNINGMGPLCVAAQNGHTDVVNQLLAKDGVDVNQANNDAQSPLLSAVEGGHANIVDLFLDNKRLKLTDELFETFGSYSEQQRLKFKKLNDKYEQWVSQLNELRKDILKNLYITGKKYTRSQFKKLSINVLRGLKHEIESKMPCAEQTGITTAKISQANAESIKRARQNKVNQLNETLKKSGIKLVVDEHDSVFLVPNNFHIQTDSVQVECDGKYITFDKVKDVTIFKQGKNKRLTKLYYSEDAKPLSVKDDEPKKLEKYKQTSQICHLGDLGVVDAIYDQKYPLGMDTKHRATVRIIFRALANDGRDEQPSAPSSQGHDQPVKPSGQKDVNAMSNVPAKNTAGNKSASYNNNGGAKKMVSGGGIGESKHGDHEEIVRIKDELSRCKQALESARKEDEAKLQSNDVQSPTPLSDERIDQVKMMIGLAVVEKINYPDKDPKIFLQEEIDEFSNYDLRPLQFSKETIEDIVDVQIAEVGADGANEFVPGQPYTPRVEELTEFIWGKYNLELKKVWRKKHDKLSKKSHEKKLQTKSPKVLELEAQLKEIKEERKAHCNDMLGRIPNNINEIDDYLGRYGEYSSLGLKTKDAKWKTGVHSFNKSRFKDQNGYVKKLYHYSRGKIGSAESVTVFFHSNSDGTLNCIGVGSHTKMDHGNAKKGCTYTMKELRSGTDSCFSKGLFYIPK